MKTVREIRTQCCKWYKLSLFVCVHVRVCAYVCVCVCVRVGVFVWPGHVCVCKGAVGRCGM